MKIYLAASYRRHEEMNDFTEILRYHGHEVVSRWHVKANLVLDTAIIGPHANAGDGIDYALSDLEDIQKCECLLLFSDPIGSSSRGGRHVEFGYALGLGKKLVLIGHRELLFHNLYQVAVYASVTEFIHSQQYEEMVDA